METWHEIVPVDLTENTRDEVTAPKINVSHRCKDRMSEGTSLSWCPDRSGKLHFASMLDNYRFYRYRNLTHAAWKKKKKYKEREKEMKKSSKSIGLTWYNKMAAII